MKVVTVIFMIFLSNSIYGNEFSNRSLEIDPTFVEVKNNTVTYRYFIYEKDLVLDTLYTNSGVQLYDSLRFYYKKIYDNCSYLLISNIEEMLLVDTLLRICNVDENTLANIMNFDVELINNTYVFQEFGSFDLDVHGFEEIFKDEKLVPDNSILFKTFITRFHSNYSIDTLQIIDNSSDYLSFSKDKLNLFVSTFVNSKQNINIQSFLVYNVERDSIITLDFHTSFNRILPFQINSNSYVYYYGDEDHNLNIYSYDLKSNNEMKVTDYINEELQYFEVFEDSLVVTTLDFKSIEKIEVILIE